MNLKDLRSAPLGATKPFAPCCWHFPLEAVGEQAWSLFGPETVMPAMVLRESALAHNLSRMADYIAEVGIELAPHGKTTMAPQIFARQLAVGAWGVTAANATQAALMRSFGVPRVLIANQVLDEGGANWLATALGDESFRIYALVDSTAGVELLDSMLRRAAAPRSLPVLIELGVPEKRTGARSADDALAVGRAVVESRLLSLVGVECFEGVLGSKRDAQTLSAVNRLLDETWTLAERLEATGALDGAGEVIVSAGGSVFFDQVAKMKPPRLSLPTRTVIRSGCYVTHDSGTYDRASPLGSQSGADAPLRPALEVWSSVLSLPEPGLAILGLGKRDAPYDSGLPVPLRLWRRGESEVRPIEGEATVSALNDQHAFCRYQGLSLDVGDCVGSGISHPCTAFDKWRLLPVVDDDYRVIDAVRTYF